MSDVYDSAAVDSFWLLKVAKRTMICMDCLQAVIDKGADFYLLVGQLSYEPKARPMLASKPVCKACFISRRELLGALLQRSA